MRPIRLPLAFLLLASCFAAGPGCRSQTNEPFTTVTRSPGFEPDSLQVVAFLGFSQGIAPEDVARKVEAMVEGQLSLAGVSFTILGQPEVESLAQSAQTRELLKNMTDFWNSSRRIDKFEVAELCRAIGAQGVLVGTIEEWVEASAARNTGDVPYTRLAASLEFYDGRDGRRTWKARSSHTLEAQGMQGDYSELRDQTVQGRERQRAATVQAIQRDQAAPPLEMVGEVVAAALARSLAGQGE